MSFPLNIYLLAFLGAGLTTWLSMPLWRRWSYRTGLVDDPGHRKIHEQPIALAGGLAVLAGLFVPLLLGGLVVACSPLLQTAAGQQSHWMSFLVGRHAI